MSVLQGVMDVIVPMVDAQIQLVPIPATAMLVSDLSMEDPVQVKY